MASAYCYGMISPSNVYVLREDFAYPKANTYAEVARIYRSVGGEAANSAVILAKLGLRTKLDGNWVHHERADQVMGLLGEFGIDLSGVTVTREGGTDEIIIADGSTRTVFGNYASFHAGPRQWNEPQRRDVQHSDIVCLDPYFRDQSRLGAEICVELGKPYVTLDCPHDGTIAQHAAAVVISHELRDQTYAGRDCLEVFTEYQEHCEGLVMFTFGSDAVWYGRRGGSRRTYQPYSIDPVDTTGAGDSFRAGIAYGLLQGWKDEQTIEFASAVAACVCLTVPHALGAPGLDGVHQFMERHRQAGPLRG